MDWLIWLIIILVVIGVFGSNAEKKQKLEAEQEALRRRTDAENYILNSGDPEAIKMLMLARANPANRGGAVKLDSPLSDSLAQPKPWKSRRTEEQAHEKDKKESRTRV